MNAEEAVKRLAAGQNVGVRLRDVDLVIDVDPRHFDVDDPDPFARLKADFGLPDAPFVVTGGGGFHHYYRKPADLVVVDGLDAYAGVEFKALGRQVVAAGSIHPETGLPYRLDDDLLAMSLSEAPEASTALLDAIGKAPRSRSNEDGAKVAPEVLAEWLSLIAVENYRDELKWRELMMACHHATGGAAVEEFVAWSTADAGYVNHGKMIRKRWNSLDAKAGSITVRTLIAALPKERRQEATERLCRSEATLDFPDDVVTVETDPQPPAFLTNRGRIESTYKNTKKAVEWGGFGIARDVLAQRDLLRAETLPWATDIGRELNDDMIRVMREWVMEQFGFEPSKENMVEVVTTLAVQNPFNPLVDYLDGLVWDGVQRIDALFPTYFGSDDSAYERAVGRKFMLAAVRRARRPGTKFDTVPILEGEQGTNKSTALRVLAGEWFSDAELGRVDGKDAPAVLQGVWIMELGELSTMKKSEVEHLKGFISRNEDRYRPPYGRTVQTFPRRCVFVGTTNRTDYLKDMTGNRRYLPVATGDIDLERLRLDRDQLWAEASMIERTGEELILPQALWSTAAELQEERVEAEPWLDPIRAYVAGKSRVAASEILGGVLELPGGRQSQLDARRVAQIMRKLGYQHKGSLKVDGRTVTGYVNEKDPTYKKVGRSRAPKDTPQRHN